MFPPRYERVLTWLGRILSLQMQFYMKYNEHRHNQVRSVRISKLNWTGARNLWDFSALLSGTLAVL